MKMKEKDELDPYERTRKLASTAAIAALTCLAGMVLRWVSPALVPFSVLPALFLLAGIILGARFGALAMVVYVLLGLLGLPVFAAAPFGGLGYVMKPTFGFLLGYIAGAYCTGLAYRGGGLGRAVVAVLAGLIALYIVGLTWLYFFFQWVMDKPQDIAAVLTIGFFPFIISDLIKAGIAAVLGNLIVKRRMKASE
ncbi:MAG: biotin transporter BioY [Peptococcaceae bacterium]|jgi:biotin transport system substrate-specific component|nr:biotin transporter BioY [Peptococcaceae bacterium]